MSRRFYQNRSFEMQANYWLDEAVSHHLIRVCRLQENEPIILFNGDGMDYAARISRIEKNKVQVLIQQQSTPCTESMLYTHILQSICRADKMDFVLQKATELGMSHFTPIIASRSNVRLSSDQSLKKQVHWQKVVQSACEQSGRAVIPIVHLPMSLSDYLIQCHTKDTQGLLLDPCGTARVMQLATMKKAALLIGPEGGFTEDEIAFAKEHHFLSIRLGQRILRTETAALSLLSILQARFGDLA